MTYCYECGRSCLAHPGGWSAGPPSCPEHGPRWVLWRSAPCAAVAVLRDGPGGIEVLLGKRGIEPWRGAWELPGGFCDLGEHPADTVVREVREELGVEVAVERLLDVYLHEAGLRPGEWRQVTTYVGRLLPGSPAARVASPEVLDVGWFPLASPPEGVVPNHALRLADLAGRSPGSGGGHP